MGSEAVSGRRRTGLAVTALVLSILSLCTAAGLIVGGLTACVLGIVAAVKASKYPGEYGGMPMAITAIVLSVLSFMSIPMIAAIAIPSLLRARVSANESSAIGDLRTVITGEAAYQSANGGYYDTLECLAAPQGCVPGYPATGPAFLDAVLASGQDKAGYARTFHPGPAPDQVDSRVHSPSSLTAYAYVLSPRVHGQTGIRAFCGDHTGVICYTGGGSPPVPRDGTCPPPPGCTVLQ
jgi:type IV pilus assembly protein PilA